MLGKGSLETAVFRGRFETGSGRPPPERAVAVKRLPVALFSHADIEQLLLLRSDSHPNIIRYYATERCDSFIYLALQECNTSLMKLIEEPRKGTNIDPLKIVKQALQGVEYLHKLRPAIVHRDITPGNILISNIDGGNEARGIVADLGLSKMLQNDRLSFTRTKQKGTSGWMAPECLRATSSDKECVKLTLKLDIFSSGCVVHYVCNIFMQKEQYYNSLKPLGIFLLNFIRIFKINDN